MTPFVLGVWKKYLNVTFKTRQDLEVRMVERPGKWMDPEEQRRILEDLLATVKRTVQGESVSYGVLTGDRESWDNSILTLIYETQSRRLVAFNALVLIECVLRGRSREVVHLGLSIVDPDWQGKGLSRVLYGHTCFLLFARGRMQPFWMSNVTQVPAVYGMIAEQFSNVFAGLPSEGRRSFDHLVLAREIMKKHRQVFGAGPEAVLDEKRLVIVNAYTGPCAPLKKGFDAHPKHRNGKVNEVCGDEIDYDRGDDFLQIGQFDLATARRYFRRARKRLSFPLLFIEFTLLLLESLAAPVLAWYSPGSQWGDLRPWKAE